VYELPEAAAATRGKAIASLVKFQEDEKLTALVAATNLEEEGRFVFMATKNGTVKKSALTEFSNPRSTGIIAINLEDKDELIGAKLTDGKKMIFLASHEGQAILFPRDGGASHGPQRRRRERHGPGQGGLRRQHGRRATGLRDHRQGVPADHAKPGRAGQRTHPGVTHHADADRLEKGYGKRTALAEYRITSRGGKGVVNMKTTDRNGSVVATLQVTEESDVMIITENGKVIRVHANEIREAGRSTQGVRLLRLDDDDTVAAAAVLQEEEAEEKK